MPVRRGFSPRRRGPMPGPRKCRHVGVLRPWCRGSMPAAGLFHAGRRSSGLARRPYERAWRCAGARSVHGSARWRPCPRSGTPTPRGSAGRGGVCVVPACTRAWALEQVWGLKVSRGPRGAVPRPGEPWSVQGGRRQAGGLELRGSASGMRACLLWPLDIPPAGAVGRSRPRVSVPHVVAEGQARPQGRMYPCKPAGSTERGRLVNRRSKSPRRRRCVAAGPPGSGPGPGSTDGCDCRPGNRHVSSPGGLPRPGSAGRRRPAAQRPWPPGACR